MELNPSQQRIMDELKVTGDEPTYDPDFAAELKDELEAGLAEAVTLLDADDQLWVSKHKLSSVHGCEERYCHERDAPFEWSPPTARGTVAHKAVELGVHWVDEPVPLVMVDRAIQKLSDDMGSLGQYLASINDAELAELRSEAGDRVASFFESFPPLDPRWNFRTEATTRPELFDGRIVLGGKVDLTLGRARGMTARKVIIDLKTGGYSTNHADDLRFYALGETLKLGTPPRALATFYLDSGELRTEQVTEPMLRSTVARVIDGIVAMIGLTDPQADRTKRVGTPCRWCPLQGGCDEGRQYLATQHELTDPFT